MRNIRKYIIIGVLLSLLIGALIYINTLLFKVNDYKEEHSFIISELQRQNVHLGSRIKYTIIWAKEDSLISQSEYNTLRGIIDTIDLVNNRKVKLLVGEPSWNDYQKFMNEINQIYESQFAPDEWDVKSLLGSLDKESKSPNVIKYDILMMERELLDLFLIRVNGTINLYLKEKVITSPLIPLHPMPKVAGSAYWGEDSESSVLRL